MSPFASLPSSELPLPKAELKQKQTKERKGHGRATEEGSKQREGVQEGSGFGVDQLSE